MDANTAAREIEAAVGALAHGACHLTMLSPPSPLKRGRSTWRVALEGGGTLKARRFESAEAAADQRALRAGLEPAFNRVVACAGPVLLETWIEGTALDPTEAEARVEEAGALLGRLHASPPPGAPATAPTTPWRAQATRDVDRLRSAGAIGRREADALHAALARHDPGSAPAALIHRDFCAENMVIDRAGTLRVIDNEWFLVDAAGLDVARTLQRWPLPATARDRFLAAYRAAACLDPGPAVFWHVFAALWGARTGLARSPARREPALAALRRCAGTEPA